MITLMIESKEFSYSEKQFHQKLWQVFYKYFPDGECWTKTTINGGRASISINCFAKQNDDIDIVNNIDKLNISLIIQRDTISTLSFPITDKQTIKVEAIYHSIKLPNNTREDIPFKTVIGDADKVLRALDRFYKNAKNIYNKYYS